MNRYLEGIRGYNDLRDRENQNALAKRAGGMLATGDATGARNALFQGGELEAGSKVDAGITSERAAKAKAMERFTQGVSRMLEDPSYANDPNGADRAWNDAARFAPQLGINPETLNQDRDSFLKNPKGWAQFWNEKAKEEQFTLSPGSARYGPDGRVVASQPFAPKSPDWRERTKADGSTEYFDINAEAGLPSGSPAPRGTPGFNPSAPDPRQPAANADQVVAALTANGARVTSGVRTPERNAAVGGQPNSYHLASRGGVARDLVPPQGVSMAQFHAQVKAQLPAGWEAINEGDHVHIEPGPGDQQARGPGTVRGDAPKGGEGPVWTPDGKGLLINKNGDRKPDPAFAGTPAAGKVTESERTAGFLSSRLADSLKNLTAISRTSPEASKPGLIEVIAESLPGTDGKAANMVRSADRQQVIANQLDVLDAALTLGTGAAYTREQLLNYRDTYFPKLTDKPATVTAKRNKLISLLTSAKIKAGRSAPPELDEALAAAKAQWGASASQPARVSAPAKANATQSGQRLSPAEAAKLKPGTKFIGEDGVERVRR